MQDGKLYTMELLYKSLTFPVTCREFWFALNGSGLTHSSGPLVPAVVIAFNFLLPEHCLLGLLAQSGRVVTVRAAADRPVWYPGNPPPPHLDGSLPGDYG